MGKFQKELILVMATPGVNITTTWQSFCFALVCIPAWEAGPSAGNGWLSIELENQTWAT